MRDHRVYWDKFDSPNRSMKQRLDRIKMLNSLRGHGKRLYKRYFLTASEVDLRLLLSLPICDECKNKQDKNNLKMYYRRYHINSNVSKKGKEDKEAKYKTDFRFTCNFCYRQKSIRRYVMGVPDTPDMIEMLKQITDDRFITNLGFLQRIYSYLSNEFVHFATSIFPDKKTRHTRFWKWECKSHVVGS